MPITYDIESDRLFKKGILRGEKRGMEKGQKRGMEKAIFNTICKMLADPKYSVEEIAQVTGTAVEYVQQVKGVSQKK